MAVVKKFQAGGSAPMSETPQPTVSLKDFLVNKLNETKFTTKGERLARNAATQFLKLHDTGKFGEVYSFDPVQQTYSIDVGKIEDNSLKGLEWGGSKDAINRNVFGQFSGVSDRSTKGEINAEQKKYNTLISSWINEYNATNAPKSTVESNKGIEKDIPDIHKYMMDKSFGGKEELMYSSFSEDIPEEEKKQRILASAKANVEQYLADWDKNKNIDSFKNVEKVQALQEAIASGDWNTFKTEAHKLG